MVENEEIDSDSDTRTDQRTAAVRFAKRVGSVVASPRFDNLEQGSPRFVEQGSPRCDASTKKGRSRERSKRQPQLWKQWQWCSADSFPSNTPPVGRGFAIQGSYYSWSLRGCLGNRGSSPRPRQIRYCTQPCYSSKKNNPRSPWSWTNIVVHNLSSGVWSHKEVRLARLRREGTSTGQRLALAAGLFWYSRRNSLRFLFPFFYFDRKTRIYFQYSKNNRNK